MIERLYIVKPNNNNNNSGDKNSDNNDKIYSKKNRCRPLTFCLTLSTFSIIIIEYEKPHNIELLLFGNRENQIFL